MSKLILVGMMGSGKSTVGRMLAEETGLPFADTDSLLEVKIGRTISQMFRLYGEETFRGHETAILKGLEPEPGVLATGGGIVLREENWTEIRRLGSSLFLNVNEEILIRRVGESSRKRPMLELENWEDRFRELMAVRRPYYMKADFVIDIETEEFDEVLDRILGLRTD